MSTVRHDGCLATPTGWGGLARLDLAGLSMLQYPASSCEAGAGGVWLRVLHGERAHPVRLADPSAPVPVSRYPDGFAVSSHTDSLQYSLRFSLHEPELMWQWSVSVTNNGTSAIEFDTVMAADIALAPFDVVRINEFYVSQYLDVTPLWHQRWGRCLAVRQNMPGPRAPWVLLGCYGGGAGWASDARQLGPVVDAELAGLRRRALPNRRLQHEHTLAVLSSKPEVLQPGETQRGGFFGLLVEDHPAATGPGDVDAAPAAPLPVVERGTEPGLPAESASLVVRAAQLDGAPLDPGELAALVGDDVRVVERQADAWWEAVGPPGEVLVSAAKQAAVLRPHGQLLRTSAATTPTRTCLTATVWMDGVFAAQLTRGHVGRRPMLTTTRTHLGLQRSQGLRLYLRRGGTWWRLGRPSTWGLRPDRARWLYAFDDVVLQVTTTAAQATDEFAVEVQTLRGAVDELLWVGQLAGGDDPEPTLELTESGAIARWTDRTLRVRSEVDPHRAPTSVPDVDQPRHRFAADAPLYADGRQRGTGWLTLRSGGDVRLVVDAPAEGEQQPAATPGGTHPVRLGLSLTGGPAASEVAELDRIVPWFGHDALVHYLSPRGLEQFTGGGWGTRDVCQGPVGLLTAHADDRAQRDLLVRVFSAQHERGDWPQAFEFLPPAGAGQPDAHGDVLFWPLLALGDFLLRSHDAGLLAVPAGFVDDDGPTAKAPISEHLTRALAVIENRTVPNSPLPAYGHGDWNDSLQPADPRLAAQMASAWTATLQVQALRALSAGLAATGAEPALARRASELADATEAALRKELLVDGVLAGYGVFDTDGVRDEVLVHPRDDRTGLTYGVLPWIHAISAELLEPDAAAHHLRLIEEHLLGPDGTRLFDAPVPYRGGPVEVFQRAEAATFWGREIGLMYTHAHLRYAEALARFGDAGGLFRALCLVNPVGVTARVAGARPRQSTCYYSSSDAAFADRYDAAARYPASLTGQVPLEGGWRVYSSGPGLFLRLLVECLLGVNRRGAELLLDPVLDPALDGLVAEVPLDDRTLRLTYRVRGPGHGVCAVRAGGRELSLRPHPNRYRRGGVLIDRGDLGEPVGGVTEVLVLVGDE
ncbi:hypothetical protein OIE40_11910 [Micropruina sp. KQZ13P-5]|nr:hypothetical protein [Micropruina sp. KQZ13P-5]